MKHPMQFGAISAGNHLIMPHQIRYVWCRPDLNPVRVIIVFDSWDDRLILVGDDINEFLEGMQSWLHDNTIDLDCKLIMVQ